jgi:lambda family phage portal protein
MGIIGSLKDMFTARNVVKKKQKQRGFDAAKSSRLYDFFSSTKSADSELRFDMRQLRDRCRDLARNNDYAKKYISLMKTNVVGEFGISMQSRARNDDRSLDRVANSILEEQWKAWGKKGNCTIDGKLSFIDCQSMVMEQLATEGECLIQIIRDSNLPWGFALKFLDNDMLDEGLNERASNGNEIRMGVEEDDNGKVVAYWLWTQHPFDDVVRKPSQNKRVRVPAEQILHIYRQERPNQTRGIPPMVTAILDLKQLNGYIEAELVAARVAAAKMGFFTSEKGDEYVGEGTDEEYNQTMNAEAGVFEQLPEGMNFQTFDPQHPTGQFASFIKQIIRSVASGLQVSYASLSNDLESVNYSSIRQGALEERHYFRAEQRFLIEHFLQPIFEAWLLMAMTKGKVNLPAFKFDKFANPHWQPRGFGNIDPLKETQSQILGLNNGIMSLQDIASLHGRDVESLFEQLQQEKDLAASMGIDLAFQPFGQNAALQQEEEKDED